MPPASPTTAASTTIPKRSSLARTAPSPPLRPKMNVPPRFRIRISVGLKPCGTSIRRRSMSESASAAASGRVASVTQATRRRHRERGPAGRGGAQPGGDWQDPRAFGIVRAMDDGRAYELLLFRTRDGEETTVYLVRHPVARTRVTVTCFPSPERLDHWCVATGHAEAIVAGFFVRDPYRPLGEVRIAGAPVPHEPVAAPWHSKRGCVHVDGEVQLARREELAAQPS